MIASYLVAELSSHALKVNMAQHLLMDVYFYLDAVILWTSLKGSNIC